MPVPAGTKFRVTTTKTGQKIRLAIRNGKVIEAKKLGTPKPSLRQQVTGR